MIGIITGAKAISILRRILAGEKKAWVEGEKLIAQVDEAQDIAKKKEEAREASRAKREKSGRKNSGKFEIAPRYERGCDHGAEGLVLARNDTTRLIWRSGSTYFSGIGSRGYAPAELELQIDGQAMSKRITNNFDDRQNVQRLTSNLIVRHGAAIDKIFGSGAARKIAPLEKTIVFGKGKTS